MHVLMPFLSLDSVPSLGELICFATPRGKINLAEEIGVDYWQFGIMLLNDETGARVTAIEKELGHNARDINCRVFQLWLSGKGRQPVSWDTLVTTLEDIGRDTMARRVEYSL